MNEKAYKFSVRDDTSFRVESGGGSSDNSLSLCNVTIENTGGRAASIIGLGGIVENEGVKFPVLIDRIPDGVTVVEDVILIDGVAHAVFSSTVADINVNGNAEISYPQGNNNAPMVTITGDATISVFTGSAPE